MVSRISAGVTFILIALATFGVAIPAVVLGIFALVAGIATLIGV